MVKLTPDIIEGAGQYINPVRDRELDLRSVNVEVKCRDIRSVNLQNPFSHLAVSKCSLTVCGQKSRDCPVTSFRL